MNDSSAAPSRARTSAASSPASSTLPLEVAYAGQLWPTQVRRRDLRRADRLDDVDDAVAVEHRQVRGLADLDAEPVADVLADLDEVELRPLLERASRAIAKPSRYLPRSETCSTKPRDSSTAISRDTVDLCTPSSSAISVTPAWPSIGQDLQDQQRAVDRLHRCGRVVTQLAIAARPYTPGNPRLPTRRRTAVDLAQAVAEQAAVQRRQLRHGDDVARRVARGDLFDLMGHPQPLQHHEHVAQRLGVALAERARLPRPLPAGWGSSPRRRRRSARPIARGSRSASPRGSSGRRCHRAATARRAATGSCTLPDSASSSCSRSAFGCSARIRGRRRARCAAPGSPHTTRPSMSSDDMISPRSRSGSSSQPLAAREPLRLGTRKQRLGGDRAVAVRRQPAAVEDLVTSAATARSARRLGLDVVAPRQRAVDVG